MISYYIMHKEYQELKISPQNQGHSLQQWSFSGLISGLQAFHQVYPKEQKPDCWTEGERKYDKHIDR